jgi:hypothetical protein
MKKLLLEFLKEFYMTSLIENKQELYSMLKKKTLLYHYTAMYQYRIVNRQHILFYF